MSMVKHTFLSYFNGLGGVYVGLHIVSWTLHWRKFILFAGI